jgi:hypothetical protein
MGAQAQPGSLADLSLFSPAMPLPGSAGGYGTQSQLPRIPLPQGAVSEASFDEWEALRLAQVLGTP